MQVVAGVSNMSRPHLISHTQRLLDYIKPDYVHIMQSGEIVKTGDMSLVDQLELSGYSVLQAA